MKRLAILLLLLATTTQSFVAQTHVHSTFAAQASAHLVSVVDAPSGDPVPTGGDHSGCLLCQIAAHGAAALPSQHSFLPLVAQQYFVAALPALVAPHSLPPTHAWSSRGPPRS